MPKGSVKSSNYPFGTKPDSKIMGTTGKSGKSSGSRKVSQRGNGAS